MGGNAFPGLQLVRIQREYVRPTVEHVVQALNVPNFTLEYALENLMGSVGKQDSSGDLDFAVNTYRARFVGERDLPTFKLREMAESARSVLPDDHVKTKTLKGGQFQTAFPVAGDPSLGLVQVDFVAGNAEWLKFSHFSPGKDNSPYKGVTISTMLGVMAKMHKSHEVFDGDVRIGRVGLKYDLEHGLYRSWQMQKRENQGLSSVTADEFETHFKDVPRFPRLNFVTSPSAVLEMLFEHPVELDEVDTFEKLVAKIAHCMPDRFTEAKERFIESFMRSAGRNDYTREEMENDEVWKLGDSCD